jgi:hypothetical protein
MANWWKRLQGSSAPRAHSAFSVFLAMVMALLMVVLGALYRNDIHIPPNTLPWRPVELNAAPGWIAHWQLNQLARDGGICRTALAQTALAFTPLADRRVDGDCGFFDVVRADRSPVAFAPRAVATCGLTAALFWYQRQLAAAAQMQMHSRLIRIEQLGTFACRNVNSESAGRRSEHATANAIDVAVFHFADGRSARVARDYGKPTAQGRFLDAAHDAGCGLFNTVLGPRYNKLHANHFHLDMGGYRICR